ncbi:TetR/AcrR family transcriptional regulator [Tardiphaga alba]|uniref:TetR/AcrR family transcriptional regulator n=1 Tax=Tardiphaga alba TaxID=340268 RepID=A0ABX8A611_9BRAD|nr:TetR/AcrR family transcriptional regulator [Tardiphaga alba]QUS38647.1 TetR/AcrR family transcriptional regulator [Tardiphaga alba]
MIDHMPRIRKTTTVAQSNDDPKPTRAEKVARNRKALLEAGAEVVGEVGYEEATIAEISKRAGLAHGTFYKHFESRQAMFDELLPTLGDRLLDEVRQQVRGSQDILEVEEKGFRGFFDFLVRNPGFYRVVNESEVVAPAAFDRHISNLARHYTRALRRSLKDGEISGFEERDLEVVAYVLMAARFYIYLRFSKRGASAANIPEWVVSAYMRFVEHGLKGK